jgi:chemotaxis protein MotB
MARKKKHEEHVNAEAWAIPYGDLVTLLFALFTVMYAMSSVNEGKFRVLSDSMIAAFQGAPKSMQPVNVGEKQPGKGGDKQLVGVSPTTLMKLKNPSSGSFDGSDARLGAPGEEKGVANEDGSGALARMEQQVQEAMKSLIDAKTVSVKREKNWLEIQINTDILFPSGAGAFSPAAEPVLDKLAEVLRPFPNPIRVEGHTDDRPIRTAAFPSNWELSAARAASVVHEFTKAGIDPLRLEIVGFGEFRPRQPNATPEGRNANRRVAILVLESTAPGATTPGVAVPGAAADAGAGAKRTVGTAVAGGSGGSADAANAANRVVSGTTPGDADKTVLVKDEGKADAPAHHE